MDVKYTRCCGLDVHNATVVACIREVREGAVVREERQFGTTTRDLEQLAAWLKERGCPIAAMESTGVYWRPVYNVLCKHLQVVVGNAKAMKPPTGKKTDKADAAWISDLLAHDLVRPSFIPEPELRALRELNRLRVRFVQQRTQVKNRIHGQLQDANIKLANVASDIFGKSGRKMIDALVGGQRDPAAMAQLAQSTLRRKLPQLELALEGSFTAHHATILGHLLKQHDLVNEQVRTLNDHIRQLTTELGMDEALRQVCTIPGIDELAGRQILAEIGIDMSHFGSDKRLAGWATVCPGNNESAGKRRTGRTRKGNRYLRRILVECAHGTERTRTQLGRLYRRFKARKGPNRAAMAVAHKMLVIIYHLLSEGTVYDDSKLATDGEEDEGGVAQGGAAGEAGSGTGGSGGAELPDVSVPDVDFGYDAPPDMGQEACAAVNVEAKLKPLDMYFMVDRSGSMAGPPWDSQGTALKTFWSDPKSAGITVALRFFPYDNSCAPMDATCSGNVYVTPTVSWGLLPGHAAALAAGYDGITTTGCTPTEEALKGALKGSKQRQLQVPGHVVVAVIVSDGSPTDCDKSDSGLSAVAASYYNSVPSIRTFALYVATVASSSMTAIAQGGGTQQAHDATNTQNFINALKAIQGSAIPCDFDMPVPEAGIVNPKEVTLKYQGQPINKLDGATQCGANAGWYFDNNTDPTKIILCPASCNAVKNDPAAKIDVSLGCLGS